MGKHSLTPHKVFLYNWDMGDKNWFEAYKSNKYFKIESNDCVHMCIFPRSPRPIARRRNTSKTINTKDKGGRKVFETS